MTSAYKVMAKEAYEAAHTGYSKIKMQHSNILYYQLQNSVTKQCFSALQLMELEVAGRNTQFY